MTPPADTMAPNDPNVRLALLEQSVERLVDLIQGLSADVRKAAETANEIVILRAEQARVSQEVIRANNDCSRSREELNARIDRAKGEIGMVDSKQEATARKLWFWHGVAWGAGALIGVTVGLLAYIGSGAMNDINQLRAELHQVEIRATASGARP